MLVLASVFNLSSISGMFFSGTARADLAARSQEVIHAINDGMGEVPLEGGYYIYIDSCESFMLNHRDLESFQVEDMNFSSGDVSDFVKKCRAPSNNGIVCLAKKIKNGGFIRNCGFTFKEPELNEPISMKTESSTLIRAFPGSEGSRSKIEVVEAEESAGG